MSDRHPPRRPSIQTRLRAWTGEYSSVALDEQLQKDAQTISTSITRRWAIIGAGLTLVLSLKWMGYTDVSGGIVGVVTFGAVGLNLAVLAIVRSELYGWWFVYCMAALDIAVVSTVVMLLGPGGLLAVFFVAILPYAFNESRTVGSVLALFASFAYIGAAALHGATIADPAYDLSTLPNTIYLDAIVFFIVATTLLSIPSALIARIRKSRTIMRLAEGGSLGVRAAAAQSDELGFLERSFNRMLDEIGGTISVVQHETDEVVILAEVLSQAATGVLQSSEAVAGTSMELAREMAEQRELADGGRADSTAAAEEAGGLRERANRVARDARRLEDAAERGRVSVERAGDALVAIGEEVRTTAESVGELSAMSERIGSFAETISRIARQTHVLALNAAIEAAHSEGSGEGFAAVADEVRALAGQAADSARDVAELIGDVQTRVDAVSRAMASGQERVKDVGNVAQDAQAALADLHRGVSEITETVEATAVVSRSQANRMASLSQKMADVAAISARSAREADGAAMAMAAQQSTIGDLKAVSGQLADLAERVRASIARFAVLHPDDGGSEYEPFTIRRD